MTFNELNQKLGGNENEQNWTRHGYGGGWVYKDAKVDITCRVGENAIVMDNAEVYGHTVIDDNVIISQCAKISKSAIIADFAEVYGSAIISDNARITDYAVIHGNAQVLDSANISDKAKVHENALVYDRARISGSARVKGTALICSNAELSGDSAMTDGVWPISPLYIQGSKHSLTNTAPGYIRIGCKCEPFKWWLSSEAEKFARDNGYDAETIEEYKAYIELFLKIGK